MLWIQGLHVIFVVTWFAGLFYLPRIFVYYAQAEDDTTRTTLAMMARKLYKFVTPLMILAVILGLWRLSYALDYYLSSLWMQLKLLGVVSSSPTTSNAVATLLALTVAMTAKAMCFIDFLTRYPCYFCSRSYC